MQFDNAGEAGVDGTLRYGREDEVDDSSVFVKYNRMLHGKKTQKGQKRDTLTIKFLKKYIHYAKHRIQPELTDEVLILHILIVSFIFYFYNLLIHLFYCAFLKLLVCCILFNLR